MCIIYDKACRIIFSSIAVLRERYFVALKTPSYWEMRGYLGSTFVWRRLLAEVVEFFLQVLY
jgi:hypothetical protein